jgi:charged multivesicular body protein 4A/B
MKKLYEKEIDSLNVSIMRIVEQRSMVEGARTNFSVIDSLAAGAKANKKIMKEFNIDRVDKVLEDISEANEQMQEMQQVLAQPTGMAADIDEDELTQELADMDAQQLEEELLMPAPVPKRAEEELPSVPTTRPSAAKTVEDELAELMGELA